MSRFTTKAPSGESRIAVNSAIAYREKVRPGTGREAGLGHVGKGREQDAEALARFAAQKLDIQISDIRLDRD